MENDKRTELDALGEFGLIQELTKDFQNNRPSTIFGIGDDCAVIEKDDENVFLITTDALVEGIHFNLMYTPLKHLGYKAVISNISDVYAMNGIAEQITVTIGVSNRFSKEGLEELYAGIRTACKFYDVDLVGGDTTSSTSGLIISITAVGTAKKKEVVYRHGAKENDLIVVSGDLGAAYMGLQVLEREKDVFKANPSIQPDLEGFDYILERQLKPEARKDIISLLKKLDVQPTAMIDISDGLASELFHLATRSKLGVRIYEEKLPLDPTVITTAIDFNIPPTTAALNGGEDYELLFSIQQKDFDKIKGNPNLTIIGHFTDKNSGLYLVDKQGAAFELKAQGWDHFKGF